MTIPD